MNKVIFKYGQGTMSLSPTLLKGRYSILINETSSLNQAEAIVQNALAHPIGTLPLHEIVKPGEKVCIVISDITRSYQRPDIFLPFIINALHAGGITDDDITILCALGSHVPQTLEEKNCLLGEALQNRFALKEHDCHCEEDLVYLGTTSRGTEISLNRAAIQCDRLILTGAIIYHDMAGYGGGRKTILPGIAGYAAVAGNHSLIFDRDENGILNPACKPGNLKENPMHLDMLEACEMVQPDFILNVVLDANTQYYAAVAGDWQKAFLEGVKLCDQACTVEIPEKGDVVIAGAGGYPKDMNLYQVSKTFSLAIEAAKPGGTIIVIAECRDDMGSTESSDIIVNYTDNHARRQQMRKEFCPEAYSGYLLCEYAKSYRLILVSGYKSKEELIHCGIELYGNPDEAVRAADISKEQLVYIISNSSSILPKQKGSGV